MRREALYTSHISGWRKQAEAGEPLEMERNGRRLRLIPDERPARLAALEPHPGTIDGQPEDLLGLDWSKEWRPGSAR